MLKKGSFLYSVFKSKCPKCQEGDFFKHKISYNPSKIITLHKNCPKCNFKYMIETSFFFGAMYVNYALSVALAVAVFIITKVFIGMELVPSFISVFIASVAFTPVLLRLSRIIYINIFVSYDQRVNDQVNKNIK